MYVVTHKQNGNEFVILGPVSWKAQFISSVIEDDTEQVVKLLPSDESKVPFSPCANVYIYKYSEVKPQVHTLTGRYDGPFWSFSNGVATGTFTASSKNIDLVRQELKQLVANIRYSKEVSGVKVTIQGVQVTVDTSRDGRNVFVQALSIMGDNETRSWKFPEAWLTLTKADLATLVQSGATYIQQQFDWEEEQSSLIDSYNLQQLAQMYDSLIQQTQSPTGA